VATAGLGEYLMSFDFPTVFDWVERLSFLRGDPGAYLLLLTAAVIVVVRDWRWSLFALLAQYVAAAVLFAHVLDPRLAIVKLFIGLFICLILYLTARQVRWGQLPEDVSPAEAIQLREHRQIRFGSYLLPSTTPFRFFLVLMVALVVWALAQRPDYQLPLTAPHINLAVYALCGLGLLGMSLTAEPLKVGMGLLTFFTGFELFYNVLEQSVAMLVMLAGANLILALVIAYLVQARHAFVGLFD
jgi:hypothetical protein